MTNVVLIVMDTARYRSMFSDPCKGPISSFFDTNGTNFTQAISPAPWTLPSHASLFTGTYPTRHGAHAGHKHLESELVTLPELLSQFNYETVAVSNNTWISEEFGFGRGFDTMYKTWQYVQSDIDFGKIAREEEGFDKYRELAKALFSGNPATNLTNAIYGQFFRKTDDDGAARTNKWIGNWLKSRDESRPFFLFVNYLEPHLEYRPPKQYAKRHLPNGISFDEAMEVPQDAWGYIADDIKMAEEDFEILQALYRAEISYLCEKIDSIVEMLKQAGTWDDTLFIVTSDHGENIGEHELMDHQYALYDTLLHVPLFVRGENFGNSEKDELVQLVDIPPMILDALDIEAPEARDQFQGISFHPDTNDTRDYAIAEYNAPQPSMEALKKRVGELPEHVYQYNRSLRTIRTDQYKYIRGSDGLQELYDIQSDPNERNNIAEMESDVIKRLDSELDDWLGSFKHANSSDDVSMSADTKSRLEDLGYLQ